MTNKNAPRSHGSPKPKKRSSDHRPAPRKRKKQQYRIRNWPDHDTALVNRGRLTLWLDQETVQNWRSQTRTGKRGKPRVYTDQAIACALRLSAVYHLPLRATEGLLASLVALAGAEVPVPDYRTLSRRRKTMRATVSAPATAEPLHLVVDGTGLKVFGDGDLKVFGDGEWRVRQHGTTKRRTWRKVHLAVDQGTGMVHAAATTTNSISDGDVLPALLAQVEQAIGQVSADGGYDRRACYEALAKRGAKAAIPPRRGVRIWQHGNRKAERLARDENLRRIRQVGRAKWKRESGYHRRSLAETAMSRLKALFGATLRAKGDTAQDTDAMLRLDAMNKMTTLGMPQSYAL